MGVSENVHVLRIYASGASGDTIIRRSIKLVSLAVLYIFYVFMYSDRSSDFRLGRNLTTNGVPFCLMSA